MNKLKLLASASLFTLLAIGFAGCGDDEVYDSKVCQTAKDCESGTKTKYLCIGETSKSNSKKVCRIDCTTGGPSACPSGGANYNCVPAGSTHKVCMKDAQEAQNQCGGQECDLTTHECKNNVCVEKQVQKTTYYRVLIKDITPTSSTEQCNTAKDAGSDIAGVRIVSSTGDIIGYLGETSRTTVLSSYSGQVPETPFTLSFNGNKEHCVYDSLANNKENISVLGCGGEAVFGKNTSPIAFKTGDKVEVYEYSGEVCSGVNGAEDKYEVWACKHNDASVNPKNNVDNDKCIKLGEGSGYGSFTVK